MIYIMRTIKLQRFTGQVNAKQRYAVNGVSFMPADTPLKIADLFKIRGVFRAGSISDNPAERRIYLDIFVVATTTEHSLKSSLKTKRV
ncbi:hypothetical protein Nepgr_032577 [Nepenthes gracilis]|uniref:Uncharacterized protein n=1 Tax=Nepenthes gracilis TaxID=150966 RepID=A0AAD3Y801_NEPGR|nr:hypothetical protein Nepgr_032577 [Nepenthes gracilis]